MEPLNLAASIVTLADLCGKFTRYLQDVKDGSQEFKDLELEIRSTQVVLKTLHKTVLDADCARKVVLNDSISGCHAGWPVAPDPDGLDDSS